MSSTTNHQNQALHRHNDARVILFVGGPYRERSFLEDSTFSRGDVLIRPGQFAHDGVGGPDSRYVRIPVTSVQLRRHFQKHGWAAHRGRLPDQFTSELLNGGVDGDDIMASLSTRPVELVRPVSKISVIAVELAQDDSAPLADIAARHGWRPWQLTRRFRRVFGMSPNRYRAEARLQRALKMIAENAWTFGRIAQEAGFCDQSHLCHEARRVTGQSPAELRRDLAI